MNSLNQVMIALMAIMVAGCITPQLPAPNARTDPTPPPASVSEREVVKEKPTRAPTLSDVERLLSYYAYASALPKDQMAKEVEQTRRFYESNGGGFARMQLALLRLAPNNEQRDPDKAIELLQTQLSAKNDSPLELNALASVLKGLINDNRQLEANLESHKEKLKEETKKSDALKQKLDALIEAERKMLERTRPK